MVLRPRGQRASVGLGALRVGGNVDGFETLVECLPEAWRADAPAQRPRWEQRLQAAAAQWPDVKLEADLLAAHAGQLLGAFASLAEGLEGFYLPDVYLTLAAVRGDPAALKAFNTTHVAGADPELRRLGVDPDDVHDIKQRVCQRLLVTQPGMPARLLTYGGRGSLQGFVRVAVVREALNHLNARRRNHTSNDEVLQDLAGGPADPELEHIKQHYRQHFADAFHAALGQLDAQQRTMLRMHLADGLSLEQLGHAFGMHRATAARHLARSRQELLSATRMTLRQTLGVDGLEFESIMRLIASRLDVSVIRHLSGS